MGYDLNQVYEGRGPLEAASIGYDMKPEDMAMRCNFIYIDNGKIITHNGGNLQTKDGDVLIKYLNQKLGNDHVLFMTGTQYRHLLVIKYGSKHLVCAPPHDHPDEAWRPLLIQPEKGWEDVHEPIKGTDKTRMSAKETADLLNDLILKSQKLLAEHPYNLKRKAANERQANSIWPWGGGYHPKMKTLMQLYPEIKTGSVISAVDLIRGIGHYAGLDIIKVPGATGLANTNYEGKAQACHRCIEKSRILSICIWKPQTKPDMTGTST
jgi:2,3-bisphosphoglycerate-independent phosphoglycerate mutase